jgi:hypothetical protein
MGNHKNRNHRIDVPPGGVPLIGSAPKEVQLNLPPLDPDLVEVAKAGPLINMGANIPTALVVMLIQNIRFSIACMGMLTEIGELLNGIVSRGTAPEMETSHRPSLKIIGGDDDDRCWDAATGTTEAGVSPSPPRDNEPVAGSGRGEVPTKQDILPFPSGV